MFIPNPWPHYPSTRCVCKPGDVETMVATRGEIEVPDGSVEVLLMPVRMMGRGKYDVTGPSKIWSQEFGLLSLEDHVAKLEIRAETVKVQEARKQADKRRKEEHRQEVEEKRKQQEKEQAKEQEKTS